MFEENEKTIILVPHGTSVEMIPLVKIKINKNKIFKKVDDLNIACSFSFGIAQYPNDGETLDDLVKFADFEMYRNKRTRREKLL